MAFLKALTPTFEIALSARCIKIPHVRALYIVIKMTLNN